MEGRFCPLGIWGQNAKFVSIAKKIGAESKGRKK